METPIQKTAAIIGRETPASQSALCLAPSASAPWLQAPPAHVSIFLEIGAVTPHTMPSSYSSFAMGPEKRLRLGSVVGRLHSDRAPARDLSDTQPKDDQNGVERRTTPTLKACRPPANRMQPPSSPHEPHDHLLPKPCEPSQS